MMKNKLFSLLLTSLFLSTLAGEAQTWQAKIDTLWASHRYEQVGEKYTVSSSDYKTLNGWSSNGATIVYYWRIAPGRIRADLVYTPTYMRRPVFGIKMIRVNTGDVIYEGSIATTALKKEKTTIEAFGPINIPADEYYRVEFTVDNPSSVTTLFYFLIQRENALPVTTMANMGGTGSHLFDFGTTDPLAPSGNAYDWAYVEGMVLSEHQHPCDYFMTIGALNSYMGFQTNGRINGGNDFNRRVLFSVWDNGNTDEDPDLPEYMQAQVFDYNHEGVSGHGGGEGSSGTIMFKDKPEYWQPDHWVQFLLNVRPENVKITMKDKQGNDSIAEAENTIMTAWYKMDNWPEWQYMASIRASFINQLIGGWYSFIENFGGNEGWGKHRVNYRHAFMRSAASGEWYNRNYVNFFPCYTDERPKSEASHGASGTMDNTFFLEYGGYNVHYDSAHYTSLLTDKTCVDTIDLDRLNARIDQALKLANRYNINQGINKASVVYPNEDWTVTSTEGVNPSHAIDASTVTYWTHSGDTHTISFRAKDKRTITAFIVTTAAQRCRYADVYISDDGKQWTLAADSIYMYYATQSEVTLPQPVTTSNIKIVFHGNNNTTSVNLNNIVFKGEYDLEDLLAEAKKYIDNQNTFNNYPAADLANLKEVYADGTCTDANALSTALKLLAKDGTLLKYGKVAQKSHVAADNAYMLLGSQGRGYLCATPEGTLTIREATVEGALPAFAAKVDVTDPYNNWQVLSTELYADKYYVYNMGTKQYLCLKDGAVSLSSEPYALNANGMGSFFYLLCNDKADAASNGKGVFIDPVAEEPLSLATRVNSTRFNLYNNYYLRPENHATLNLIKEATRSPRLNATAERASRVLALEDGIVGSLADKAEKTTIETLYNNGEVAEADLATLEQALDNAKYVEIDNSHSYRILPADNEEKATQSLTAEVPWVTLTASAEGNASQLWTLTSSGSGYRFSAQQYGFDVQPVDNTGNLHLITADKSFAYQLSPATEGSYYLSQAAYQPYTVSSKNAYASIQRSTADGVLWKIKPAETYEVKLNAAGVALMYVDFDTYVPEGVSAYIADHVDADGVIRLLELNDTIPHATPVVLHGDAYATVALGVGGQRVAPYDGANILIGTCPKKAGLPKNTCYTLKTASGKAVMKTSPVSANVAENKAYILAAEGLPELDTYTFDFDNPISAIKGKELRDGERETGKSHFIYDLQGRKQKDVPTGIYIKDGKKVKDK